MKCSLALFCLLALSACHESSGTPDGGEAVDAGVDAAVDARTDVPLDAPSVWDGGPRFTDTQANKIDLLIVTEEESVYQAALSAGIPWITRALTEAGVDVRVGVIGSDLGDPSGATCERPIAAGGALIPCDDSGLGLFFDPAAMDWEEISSEMWCRLPVSSSTEEGVNECELAQSFDALLAAMLPEGSGVELNTPMTHGDGANGAFFRRDGYLAVLMLTVPDDCSVEDPELSTSDRYEGETTLQRCIFNPGALRDAAGVAETLLHVRGHETFGFYSVSNMPSDLSGRPAAQILADPRMAPGELLEESIALALGARWDPAARVRGLVFPTTPSRRIIQLSAALTALGVHTGTFSYQGEVTATGQAAFEDAVAPLVARMLEGLRQAR